MSERSKHTFQFRAGQISDAAAGEAEYHRDRLDHWIERRDRALHVAKASVGVTFTEHEVTGDRLGAVDKMIGVQIDYGDGVAWEEYELAYQKVKQHRAAVERFVVEAETYGTQAPGRVYELDADDIRYFRLGGQPRDD